MTALPVTYNHRPPFFKMRGVNFICIPWRRRDPINYERGWKYDIGGDLFKGGYFFDTFLD